MNKAEVASILVRVAASAGLAWLTVKLLAKYLDPSYASKEENKKRVAKLFEEIGLSETAELDEHELRICLNMISGDQSGVDWDEIGGYEEIVAELKDRIILPLRIANEYKNPLLCPPRGVLLYGPPGCGKTLLAKAVARAAQCRFINLQVSNLTDKWYGESQKLAAAVFSVARKFQPVIIFIDEIDTFLRDRQSSDHEATSMMKAQFMTLWDGFSSSHQNDQIIIMGATNRPNDVDSAILRRLPARFHIDKPNSLQREKIFQVTLRDEPVGDIDFPEVASVTNGLTGSDIKEVCRIAVLSNFKATLAGGGSLDHREPLQTADLLYSVQKYLGKEEHPLD